VVSQSVGSSLGGGDTCFVSFSQTRVWLQVRFLVNVTYDCHTFTSCWDLLDSAGLHAPCCWLGTVRRQLNACRTFATYPMQKAFIYASETSFYTVDVLQEAPGAHRSSGPSQAHCTDNKLKKGPTTHRHNSPECWGRPHASSVRSVRSTSHVTDESDCVRYTPLNWQQCEDGTFT
jgi:hypothetical protein